MIEPTILLIKFPEDRPESMMLLRMGCPVPWLMIHIDRVITLALTLLTEYGPEVHYGSDVYGDEIHTPGTTVKPRNTIVYSRVNFRDIGYRKFSRPVGTRSNGTIC